MNHFKSAIFCLTAMALCLQSYTKEDREEGTESEMASAGFWKIQINNRERT